MIEVDYGGGGHRTRLKINDQLVCIGVPPPPYIKELGGRRPARRRAHQGGSPTPTGSRTPPFLVGVGEGGKEGEKRKERGAPPPLLVQFGLGGEGRAAAPRPPLLFLH